MDLRYFIKLIESASLDSFKPIASLPPMQQKIALEAFAHLGSSQRGKPEFMGTSMKANPGMFNAMGAFCYLAEHIGDLTHRMSEKYCERMNYGYGPVQEKVNRGLRYFENGYGFEREVKGNIKNNFRIRHEENPSLTFDDFVETFKAGAKKYANAHRELTVYNEAQWHAREAAISLGDLEYNAMYGHLKALREHLEEGIPEWCDYASLVNMDGNIIKPYF
jgi:hypothetical protein